MNPTLRNRLASAGAAFGSVASREVVDEFGDVSAEYAAVRERAGISVRGDLVRLRMCGRDPVKMLQGLITNDLANAPDGQGVYAAMLTPKGRTITDLRAFRIAAEGGTRLAIDLPAEAAAGTREHLKKFVPPLFARWEDASDATECIGVYGPEAEALVRGVLSIDLPGPLEDAYREVRWNDVPVLAIRTQYVGLENGFDLVVDSEVAADLWSALTAHEHGVPVGYRALETLRVEAGRPRSGAELTEDTIPTEAFQETGLLGRAISFTKGCYTGQEVIIRIAHRGHVNRHLRGLLLGDVALPPTRTSLFQPVSGKEVGWTTSATHSPLLGQTISLGYVRREVEPGHSVRVGTADGAEGTVALLPFTVER